MDQSPTFTDALDKLNNRTIDLLNEARLVPGLDSDRFDDWILTCRHIKEQVAEDLIRLAVVGSIKSGKSTFANAVLGGDYLKRGAGVVTSMVTRVHRGPSPAARLFLKSWDEINAEIAQAMVLLPDVGLAADEIFDLRKQDHRRHLQEALERMGSQLWTSEGTRDINGMLLSSYLKGYADVADLVGVECTTLEFGADEIDRHRDFTGHDRRAVYLQDILLEINTEGLLPHVELADCQGSDSPNPLHLAMIQEYLRLTHLIIYVISSRTGLRRADIRFLSMIKKMGLLPNVVFVINCDFSEHESLESMQTLIAKTGQELALLEPQPEIYSLSALFRLFQGLDGNISPKDRQRMAQWQQEREFVDFVDEQWRRFTRTFNEKVTRERYVLFTQSHLIRLKVILNGLAHLLDVNGDLLSRDIKDVQGIKTGVRRHRGKIDKLQNMLKSTLDGETGRVKQELRQAVERFFDERNGRVFESLLKFIRQYQPALDNYREQLLNSGLSPTLYTLFQDFRRSVDAYMAETVNPEILSFIRNQETRIQDHFQGVADPYHTLAADALIEYNQTIQEMGLPPMQTEPGGPAFSFDNLDRIKRMTDLAPPPAQNTMRYSAKIRSDAVLRLGFYAAVQFFRRIMKKNTSRGEEHMRALQDGLRGIKRETEKSLRAHFRDYRENLKFQYLNKLVESVSNHIYESLTDRLKLYGMDLSGLEEVLGGRDSDRRAIISRLDRLGLEGEAIKQAVRCTEEDIIALADSP